MSESKRKLIDEAANKLTRELIKDGRLIEAGFAIFAHFMIPKNASHDQVEDMRLAFMAGAEHVFSSVMTSLDPGEEPTEADMQRLDAINSEITEWRARLSERVAPAQGRA